MHKKEFIIEAIANDKDYGFVGETIWQLPESNLLMERKGELVRCKNCKFNEGYCENETFNSHLESLGLDGGALFETSPDFYCTYGRRKEE